MQMNVGKNTSTWRCEAMVPNAKGTKRVTCNTENTGKDAKCTSCGASRGFDNKTHNATSTENTMSNVKPATENKSETKNSAKSVDAAKAPATPDAAKAPAVVPANDKSDDKSADAAKGEEKKAKVNRLKYVSTTDPAYYVRIRPEQATKGAPRDFNGVAMLLSSAPNAPSKKAQKIERKEQEEKLLANMTDEQKLEYATKKRLERKAEKDKKEMQRKEAMMAELRQELEAKGLAIVPKDAVKA